MVMMRFAFQALLATAPGTTAAFAQWRDLPPVPVKSAAEVFAPVIVGRPPCDAYIGLLRMDDGEIRHYNYGGSREGNGPLYIFSRDGGLTWSRRELPPDFIGADQRSPVSGDYLRMFVHWRRVGDNDHVPVEGERRGLFVARSKGGLEGEWQVTPVYPEPLRTIRAPLFIRGGKRVIVPCQKEQVYDGGPRRNGAGSFYSDDDGRTWKLSNFVTAPHFAPTPPHRGPRWEYGTSEATVVELKDGRLWLLARTSQDVLYESFSENGGEAWSPVRPSRFYSTLVMPTMARLRDGRILLVWSSTTPLPEVERNEATRFFIGTRAFDGRGEDVFTNRDALHAAISGDDGRSWTGFRELVLNLRRNDPGNAETGGIDRSVHQSQFVETREGKVLVSCGQHPLHRLLVVFDPRWLYEKSRSSSFENGLDDWSVHKYVAGIRGHCAFNRKAGATLVDHPDKPGRKAMHVRRPADPMLVTENDGAVWNFPAAAAGRFTVRLMLRPGGQGARITLLDRWVNPTDLVSDIYSMFNWTVSGDGAGAGGVRLAPGRWHELEFAWERLGTPGQDRCRISVDGKSAGALTLARASVNGINYVHLLSTAKSEDKAGFLVESVAARAR